MKPLNRYMSLLLICGLMLPLHDEHTYNNIGKKNNAPSYQEKAQSIKPSDCKTGKGGFSFFKDVILGLTPALKKLR